MTDTPDCGFCAIAGGTHDAVMVAETEHTLAFLDRSPLFKGHTLVVPREHVVTLRDLPDRPRSARPTA